SGRMHLVVVSSLIAEIARMSLLGALLPLDESKALKRKLNEGEMIIDAGNNPFYVSEHGKNPKGTRKMRYSREKGSEKSFKDYDPEILPRSCLLLILLSAFSGTLFFTNSCKEYDIQLNRATSGAATRPGSSCLVNGISVLNSDIKPPGCTPPQQQKDRLKVQLRGINPSINC
ncbi:17169_t:CDS:2, partial [Cetraspora pellucida]